MSILGESKVFVSEPPDQPRKAIFFRGQGSLWIPGQSQLQLTDEERGLGAAEAEALEKSTHPRQFLSKTLQPQDLLPSLPYRVPSAPKLLETERREHAEAELAMEKLQLDSLVSQLQHLRVEASPDATVPSPIAREFRGFEEELQRQRQAIVERSRDEKSARQQEKDAQLRRQKFELSAEERETVQAAWSARLPQDEELSTIGAISLSRKDLRSLAPGQWLNDEVVNATVELLKERQQRCPVACVRAHFFNTFFWPMLERGGYSRVRKWTNTVDLFSMHRVFVPVHLGNHWCLAVIHVAARRIEYLDSLGGKNLGCLRKLAEYLGEEHAARKNAPLAPESWKLVCLDVPRQTNSDDCGMFCCKFMEALSQHDVSVSVVQPRHMPYYRSRLLLDLLNVSLPTQTASPFSFLEDYFENMP